MKGRATSGGALDYDFVTQDVDGTTSTVSGWSNPYPSDYTAGRLTLISDGSAPIPSHVVQVMYPVGFASGISPGEVDYAHTTASEYYVGFYFKISNPYQYSPSGHNKIAYFYTTNGREAVLEFNQGPPLTAFLVEYVSDAGGAEVDHAGTKILALNTWYKFEFLMSWKASRLRWWVDGALDIDIPANLSANAGTGVTNEHFSPTYGGGGPNKTEVDYVWYDHIHMSGLP